MSQWVEWAAAASVSVGDSRLALTDHLSDEAYGGTSTYHEGNTGNPSALTAIWFFSGTVSRIHFTVRYAYSLSSALEFSDDGSTWFNAVTGIMPTGMYRDGVPAWVTVDISTITTGSHPYWRLVVSDAGASTTVAVSEFRLYSGGVLVESDEAIPQTSGLASLSGSASGVCAYTGAASAVCLLVAGIALFGQAAGAAVFSGSASGDLQARCSGVVSVNGSVSAARAHVGSASGLLSASGSASGGLVGQGASSGRIAVSGSASGHRSVLGQASGQLLLIGAAASGRRVFLAPGPLLGTNKLAVTGSASGIRGFVGAASGAASFVCVGTGQLHARGSTRWDLV